MMHDPLAVQLTARRCAPNSHLDAKRRILVCRHGCSILHMQHMYTRNWRNTDARKNWTKAMFLYQAGLTLFITYHQAPS